MSLEPRLVEEREKEDSRTLGMINYSFLEEREVLEI